MLRTCLLLIFFCPPLAAQDVHITPKVPIKTTAPATLGQPRLRLGGTRENLHLMLGEPQRLWVPRAGRSFEPSQYDAVAAQWGRVLEVYSRRTDNNEYEIMVSYKPDASGSQLHPVQRVAQIRFQSNRPQAVAAVLRDIVEIGEMCDQGCQMVGRAGHPLQQAPEIQAYVLDASFEQVQAANQLASDFGKNQQRAGHLPGLYIQCARGATLGGGHDWRQQPVESVIIAPVDPAATRYTMFGNPTILEFGLWTPEPDKPHAQPAR